MDRPSGDQSGPPASTQGAAQSTARTAPFPSQPVIQRSRVPSASTPTNAKRAPSGAQATSPETSFGPPERAGWTSSVPGRRRRTWRSS